MIKDLRHNYYYNLLDAAFFGLAVGFASFSTVIPLFVSQLTDSQTLIGLVPAVHNVGWMGPQLFTAASVARQRRLKSFVLWMTLHERIPYLGLAFVAWFYSRLGLPLSISFTFVLLTWQGLGAGFTANAWQSLIAKILPPNQRGTFLGFQAATANITIAVGAIIAGQILERVNYPINYVTCFLIACVWFTLSWLALAQTREEESLPDEHANIPSDLLSHISGIWKSDGNFRLFLLARNLTQFSSMGFAFYVIYSVRHFGIGEGVAGLLTATLATSQIFANASLGWLGDRIGNRTILIGGALTAIASTALALFAPVFAWMYPAVVLAGVTNVTAWTISMTMTMEFGSEHERPTYIGMANSLVAPSTIIAPIFGGWLADITSYTLTFGTAILCGLVTVCVFVLLRDPRNKIIPHRISTGDV